ncbi:MAG: hypothetical protein WCW87_01670 [Candidatus Paceibacterota bacterium]
MKENTDILDQVRKFLHKPEANPHDLLYYFLVFDNPNFHKELREVLCSDSDDSKILSLRLLRHVEYLIKKVIDNDISVELTSNAYYIVGLFSLANQLAICGYGNDDNGLKGLLKTCVAEKIFSDNSAVAEMVNTALKSCIPKRVGVH